MRGGAGGTSSKAGGAYEGARRRCIGRGGVGVARSLCVARCACGGRASPPEPLVKLREKLWPVELRRATLARLGLLSSRSELAGVMVGSRGASGAPGQPHSNS